MSSSPPPTYDATTYLHTSGLKPYLELPHLYSLTWLAYPILSLLFVAFRLIASSGSTQDAVDSAKRNLIASCKAAEKSATSVASMPRYMALATNEQFSDAVNATLRAARATLVLSLTIMEAIINFIIDLYRSTFLCFLELVVRGGLAILISAVEELNQLVQSAAAGLRTTIQDSISSANSVIQSAIDGINAVNPFSDITAPTIDVPSLDALTNLTLPSSIQDGLTNLNNSIPSVEELKGALEEIINTPFELLKRDINDTFSTMNYNSSMMPVPQQSSITFCNDLDTSVVDNLGRDLIKMTKIGIVVIIALALVLIALNCLLEWYKWRCMKAHFEYTRQAWSTDPTIYRVVPSSGVPQFTLTDHNLLMLEAASAHPLVTRITNNLSRLLRLSPTGHTHLSWFFHYVFHPPALACLLIGVIGLLTIQIQLIALDAITDKYQQQSASTSAEFSNTIATAINSSMYNSSAEYARSVNLQVDGMQDTINNGVFGWVNGTTTTLNNTIVGFYDEVQGIVGTVFNGTILEAPAREFIRCLIGTKVDAIENALTFLHDNLVIDMPRMNDSALVLSKESVDEATKPVAAAAVGEDKDGDGGVVGRLINSYAETLRKERVMFAIFIALWGFVVLMALAVILWHTHGKKLVEKRKRRRWERTQRSGVNGLVVPFRVGAPAQQSKEVDSYGGSHQDLPSFTPLPSPKPTGGFNFFSRARSASPAPNRSMESLPTHAPKTERSWDSFFGSNSKPQGRERTISKPKKLMAIGRKAMGKEQLADDASRDRSSDFASSETSADSGRDNRSTAWFGRFATMLGKKESESEPNGDRRGRPDLRISVGRTSTQAGSAVAPASRWSVSPADDSHFSLPWVKVTSPTSSNRSVGTRPPPRKNSTVPTDVGSVYEDSTLPVPSQSIPLAPPLHHGFSDSSVGKQPIAPSAIYFPPPPPRHPHRRSSSIPSTPTSLTPVTRLLTSIAAETPRNSNPFVTPFDDEHRVTIDQAPSRRSIPTNPFAPVAL